MNISGWYALLFFVPIGNLALFIWIFFRTGTKGTNKFGEEVRKNKKWHEQILNMNNANTKKLFSKKIILIYIIAALSISVILGLIHYYKQHKYSPLSKTLDAEQIYEKVADSIYKINSGKNLGTSVAISENILVTNCHLLSHEYSIWINGQLNLMQIINSEYNNADLCFLYVEDMDLKPVHIRSSSDVKIGESVYAIGNPQGYEKTLSRGIVSNKDIQEYGTFLQTDAAVSPGSSGGGLFDNKANLIGIISKADRRANAISFAAPTEPILNMATELRKISKKTFNSNAHDFNHMISLVKKYEKENKQLIQELNNCSKNNKYCAAILGEIYYEKKLYSLAYPLLAETHQLESTSSAYFLSIMFQDGLGVKRDSGKAKDYLIKSAELGDPKGASYIGYMFINKILSSGDSSRKNSAEENDDLIFGYVWIKLAKGLGKRTYTYDGKENDINILIEILIKYIKKNNLSLDYADNLAKTICSKTPRCVLYD